MVRIESKIHHGSYSRYVYKKIRGYFLKKNISNKDAQIIFRGAFTKIKIVKDKSAKIIVRGKLEFGSSMDDAPIYINLAKNATLLIDGDLIIGNGVQILVAKNGLLRIGGRENENASILGSGSKIYVLKKVEIGKDFICAYNVFITDCDWHYIEYSGTPTKFQSDTIIGIHVWVAHESSLLKGTILGHGSIVGCRSVLSQKNYPENSLVAGIPARVVKSNCKWKYELPTT
jgi:acetyltransferase-like isoleucine patch superfamily enzyme